MALRAVERSPARLALVLPLATAAKRRNRDACPCGGHSGRSGSSRLRRPRRQPLSPVRSIAATRARCWATRLRRRCCATWTRWCPSLSSGWRVTCFVTYITCDSFCSVVIQRISLPKIVTSTTLILLHPIPHLQGYTTIYEVPFNSVTKTASAIARDPEDHTQHIVMLKGAPEKVLEKCDRYLYNGVERPIDDDFKSDFNAAYERFALMGERVLGFAYQEFRGRSADVYKRDENSYPQRNLCFCGLISLVDPPKPGVDDAIDICRDAYIRVTMVTGDHPLTAEAIARKVGIITLPTAREVAVEEGVPEEEIPLSDERVQAVVIAGYALPSLSEEQWGVLLKKEEVVFARTTPQQKLQIVEHYQRLGEVVAVTGDGTNDSPGA